jgi:hypothetical protein
MRERSRKGSFPLRAASPRLETLRAHDPRQHDPEADEDHAEPDRDEEARAHVAQDEARDQVGVGVQRSISADLPEVISTLASLRKRWEMRTG